MQDPEPEPARSGGLRGTWYVVPTPFHTDRHLDVDSQRVLVDAAVDWGVDGLAAMGVMSEAHTLTDVERHDALRAIFDGAAGRLPIIVGCSATSAHRSIGFAREAAEFGAAAVFVAAPPLMRNVDLLPDFLRSVREGARLPIVVQDEPSATGTLIPTSVLLAAMDACGSVTVKLEDPPTPTKVTRLLTARPELCVFGGLGGVPALSEMRRGAAGTMTGFSYPEVLRAVRLGVEQDELQAASRVFDRFLPLIAFEGQPSLGLAIRKEILRRRGVLANNSTRATTPIDEAAKSELDDVLARIPVVPSPDPLDVE